LPGTKDSGIGLPVLEQADPRVRNIAQALTSIG